MHKWEFGKPLFDSICRSKKLYRIKLWIRFVWISSKNFNIWFWFSCYELCLGLLIAILLTNMRRTRGIFSAIFIIPIVIMPAMVGLTWKMYLSYDGLVN